jgi:hypothetical protein
MKTYLEETADRHRISKLTERCASCRHYRDTLVTIDIDDGSIQDVFIGDFCGHKLEWPKNFDMERCDMFFKREEGKIYIGEYKPFIGVIEDLYD